MPNDFIRTVVNIARLVGIILAVAIGAITLTLIF